MAYCKNLPVKLTVPALINAGQLTLVVAEACSRSELAVISFGRIISLIKVMSSSCRL